MVNRYDVETGLEMFGGGLGGVGLGTSKSLIELLGPSWAGGLGAAVGLGSMAMSLAARHKRREAYKENKAAISKAHELNVARMGKIHGMQRLALSSGQKGSGGGHDVGGEIEPYEEGLAGATGDTGVTGPAGPSRAGTVQRQAVTQQKEIAGKEVEAELLATRAAHARNKAREGAGGSRSALESMLGIGMAIAGMLPKASPKVPPSGTLPWEGAWNPYEASDWFSPNV